MKIQVGDTIIDLDLVVYAHPSEYDSWDYFAPKSPLRLRIDVKRHWSIRWLSPVKQIILYFSVESHNQESYDRNLRIKLGEMADIRNLINKPYMRDFKRLIQFKVSSNEV